MIDFIEDEEHQCYQEKVKDTLGYNHTKTCQEGTEEANNPVEGPNDFMVDSILIFDSSI